MVDTFQLPTIFFTHSAADLQWPELARLICPDDPGSKLSSTRLKVLNDNPAGSSTIASLSVEMFYKGVLITGCVSSGNTEAVPMFMECPASVA